MIWYNFYDQNIEISRAMASSEKTRTQTVWKYENVISNQFMNNFTHIGALCTGSDGLHRWTSLCPGLSKVFPWDIQYSPGLSWKVGQLQVTTQLENQDTRYVPRWHYRLPWRQQSCHPPCSLRVQREVRTPPNNGSNSLEASQETTLLRTYNFLEKKK